MISRPVFLSRIAYISVLFTVSVFIYAASAAVAHAQSDAPSVFESLRGSGADDSSAQTSTESREDTQEDERTPTPLEQLREQRQEQESTTQSDESGAAPGLMQAQERQAAARAHRSQAAQEAQERREQALAQARERRSEALARASERIYTGVSQMMERLIQHTERLENILTRVMQRLDTLADEGYDTSIAAESVESAEGAVADAAEGIVAVQEAVETALDSDNPREQFAGVRSAAVDATAGIRTAHRAVADAISSIRTVVSQTPDIVDTDPASTSSEPAQGTDAVDPLEGAEM